MKNISIQFRVSLLMLFSFFYSIGFGQLTRNQIINNANIYKNYSWTANSSNFLNSVSCGGKIIQTPSWIQIGTNTAMPYCWGGWTSTTSIQGYLNSGKSAGDKNTSTTFGAEPNCAVGLDCSGFISRAWGLSSKQSTNTLPNISTLIALSAALPGDILNDAGSHVRLFTSVNGNGSINVIESSAKDWKVSDGTYTAAQLSGYEPRCPNSNIVTGGCGSISAPSNDNCSNAITLTPNTSCSITSGSIAGANQSNVASGCPSGLIQDVWYKFTASSNGIYTIKLDPSNSMDGVVEVRQGSCSGTVLDCADSGGGNGGIENLDVTVTNGTTYYIRVYEYNSIGNTTTPATTSFDICVTKTTVTSTLTVTSPDGGENWQAGTTHSITWTSSPGVTGSIQIQPYINGSPLTNIAASAPNTGTYSWTIPSDYTLGTTYKIGISALSGTVADLSNNNFTISSPPSSLTISPTSLSLGSASNSNGQIVVSSNISWTASDDASWLSISPTSGSNNGTITATATSENTSTSSRNGTVTITGSGITRTVSVTQNGATATIAVTSPVGGENWQAGTTHSITWTSSPGVTGSIQIQPYLNGSPLTNIAASAPNTGTYSWAIPSDYTPGTTYKIGISAMSGTVADLSNNNFTISSPPSSLTISPTSLSLGSASNSNGQISVSSNISWTASDDASWLSISPTSGSNNGTITATATSENTSTSSRNGTVTIRGSGITRTVSVTQNGATATFAIISPDGGENWQAGTTHSITWTSSPGVTGSVQIQPYINGSPLTNIAASAPNTGSYSWTIPSDYTPGTTYKIGISAMSGTVADLSNNNFTISSPPSSLTISPTSLSLGSASNSNGQINVSSNISWTASDVASWLSILPTSGSNNGTITATATSENTSTSSRNGTVTITGSGITRTVSVTQNGTESQICTPVTIKTQPQNISVNQGSTATFSVSVDGTESFSYFWYKNGVLETNATNILSNSNSYVTPTLTAGNNGDYYYCLITNCNNSYQAKSNNANLTVNSIPDAANTISGITTVCKGSANMTYTVGAIRNATSYVWTLPSGATGSSTTNTISITFGNNAVSSNIKVKGHNSEGDGAESTLAITVNNVPSVSGSITGNNSVCISGSETYTLSAITGATSYVWTLPTGATGTSSTNSITVNYGTNTVSGNITVKGHNSCGDGAASTLAITVNSKPTTPVVTLNANILHSNASTGNQWYNQNALINGATNQDYTFTAIGNYSVIVTINGCSSEPSALNVVTGFDPNETNPSIKVYPNPITNELNIEFVGNTVKTEFVIVNSKGQVVFSGNLFEKVVIQTSNFSTGLYFIKLKSGKTIEFKKVVKL